MLRLGAEKTLRLKNSGILTRVAILNANVKLTNEVQIEVGKGILTMQEDYSQRNLEKVFSGEKWIKLSKFNTKGKPKWTASIKQINKLIFRNITNEEMHVENLMREVAKKMTFLKHSDLKMK